MWTRPGLLINVMLNLLLGLLIAQKVLMMDNLLEVAICCCNGMIAGMKDTQTSSGHRRMCGWLGDGHDGLQYTGSMLRALLISYLFDMEIG